MVANRTKGRQQASTERIQISANESIYRFVPRRQLAKLYPWRSTIPQINGARNVPSEIAVSS